MNMPINMAPRNRNFFPKKIVFTVLPILLITLIADLSLRGLNKLGTNVVEAQESWEIPTNLSKSDNDSLFPSIATDLQGNVHLVWCEPLGDHACNALFYAAYYDGGWSDPANIVFAENKVSLQPSLAIDYLGTLHLAWIGGFSDSILYSTVAQDEAYNPRAWRTPFIIGEGAPAESPDLEIGPDGVLHIVYSIVTGQDRGIFYSRSQDSGVSWTLPSEVSSPSTEDVIFNSSVLAVDGLGTVHVTWTEAILPNTYPPQNIQYARSEDGGISWQNTLTIDGPYGFSILFADSRSNIHLAWSGTADERHKFHALSSDAGETWSAASVSNEIGGFQGKPALDIDSSGRIHLLEVAGGGDESLYHKVWSGQDWSEPVNLISRLPDSPNHLTEPDAAIGLGNELHVAISHFIEDPDQPGSWHYDIYYTASQLNTPQVIKEPATLESQQLEDQILLEEPAPTREAEIDNSIIDPTTSPNPTFSQESNESSRIQSIDPVVIGVVASIAILVIVILIARRRKNRR